MPEGQAPSLTRIYYTDLWPGIDLEYETTTGGIARSTWRLATGVDVAQIRLRYNLPVEIAQDGSLRINYQTGWMRESAPVAWQEIGGKRKPVEVAFRLHDSAQGEPVVGFEVGAYDSARPLVIDPTLAWNTFMGSTTGTRESDIANGIASNASGNVYVTGYSRASWGTPVNPFVGGHDDAFVAKITKIAPPPPTGEANRIAVGLGGPAGASWLAGWLEVKDDDLSHLSWGQVNWPTYCKRDGMTRPAVGGAVP